MKTLRFFCSYMIYFFTLANSEITEENNTPIIAVLSQETSGDSSIFPDGNYDSYIAASYIKFVESAGARAIPVWIGQSEEYYRRVVQYTNGLLLPGGTTNFTDAGGYGEAATLLYNIAVEYNLNGVYYPVWGTCMGMEVLMFTAVNGTHDVRVVCSLPKVSLPLDFAENYQNSRLFSQAPPEILEILGTKNTTYNHHTYCITRDVMAQSGISDEWNILATNKDSLDVEFVSVLEHVEYPIYGVQFHPEKNVFEFSKAEAFPHSADDIKPPQFFANFLVNESRKNGNKFSNDTLEAISLIYNFNPIYTGVNDGYFEQSYGFLKEDYEKFQLL